MLSFIERWLFNTNTLKKLNDITSFIFVLLTLIALIIILSQTYTLKHVYEVGERTEKECGDEFYEKDRGDYKVKQAYDNGVKELLDASFKILAFLISVVALTLAIIQIALGFEINTKNVLSDKSYNNITVIGNTTNPPNWLKKKEGSFTPVLAKAGRLMQIIIHILLLILTLYIFSIWLANVTAKVNTFNNKGIAISPLNTLTSKSGTASMYASQLGYLISLGVIAGFVILLLRKKYYKTTTTTTTDPPPIVYLFETDPPSENSDRKTFMRILTTIIIVLVIAAIIIPFVSSVILKIRKPIDEYESNFNNININTNNDEERAALTNNIYRDNPTEPFPSSLVNYTPEQLKSYVTHNVNYSDIQAIPVPNDLREYIHQSSLRGESFMNFKQDLVAFYNEMNNSNFAIPQNGTNPPNFAERSGNNVKNKALYIILKHFKEEYRIILLLKTNLTENQVQTKRLIFEILNDQVVQNSAYSKANPFSNMTLTKLRQMRENKSIRDAVNNMHSVSSGVIFTIFALALYFIIHYYYLRNPRNAMLVITSIIVAILIIGVGFVGFIIKDTWL